MGYPDDSLANIFTRSGDRTTARLLTGPLAFLVAGVIDVGWALLVLGRRRLLGVSGELSAGWRVCIDEGRATSRCHGTRRARQT
jgi:hypothetical protein